MRATHSHYGLYLNRTEYGIWSKFLYGEWVPLAEIENREYEHRLKDGDKSLRKIKEALKKAKGE